MRSFKLEEIPSTSREAVESAINLTKEEDVLWEEDPCPRPSKRVLISEDGTEEEEEDSC